MPSPKMCKFQLRGECRYGVKCWNSHDLETSRQRALCNTTTTRKAYDKHLARTAHGMRESTTSIDDFFAQLEVQDHSGRPDESTNIADMEAFFAQLEVQDHSGRPDESTNIADMEAFFAQLEVQDHSGRPDESTNIPDMEAFFAQLEVQDHSGRPDESTNIPNMEAIFDQLEEQYRSGRPDQSTNTALPSAFITQLQVHDHCASPSQSTSTTSTNALIAQLRGQDNYASPAQSTSTTSANALIAQIQVQDLCARPLQSTSTSTNSTNSLISQEQAQKPQLQLEASMKPLLKQPDNSKIAMEMVANELSVEMKTGNGNSKKETASNFYALHQKKMKERTENDGSAWDDILMSAIDSDLLCNICFEIFIKPTVLNCSHTFCESCILIWTNRVIACPICRVEVKSKSYCLTLESFIEKIVEHFPKEIKDKREVEIKDRINMKNERPQRVAHRLSRSGLSGLMLAQQVDNVFIPPPQYQLPMNPNVDFNTDVLFDESEIFRMNLHDTVVSTGGVNPLMSYVVGPEEQTSNRRITRPYNSSTRH